MRRGVITVRVGAKVHRFLEAFAGMGILGTSPEQVAERFICEGIQRRVETKLVSLEELNVRAKRTKKTGKR